MLNGITDLPQAYLLRLADRVLKGNTEFAGEDWEFVNSFTQTLIIEKDTYFNLVEDQDLSQGKKEKLVQTKNQHFEKEFVPLLRKIIHYIRATADDADNVLNSYGFDPGDFPRREPDVIMLGTKIQHGDDDSQGEPWALTVKMRQQLDDDVLTAQTLVASIQVDTGEAQEITQNQDESRARLEKLLIKAREWLYAMVPQGRHDEILEIYGFKPIREASHKKKDELPAPGNFKFADDKQEFTWDHVVGELLFELEISRDDGKTWVQKYKDVDTWFNAGHLDTGKALARVRALDGYQDPGKWTKPLAVKFKLLAPAFVAYTQYKNEFIWNWVPFATRYELEISPDGTQWSKIYDGPNNHVVIPLEKGDYSVRARAVRAESPDVFSDWSKVVPVNIIFIAPAGLHYDSSAHKIKWDKVTGAAQYQVINESGGKSYIGADNHFDIVLTGQEKFRVRAGDGTMLVWGEWSPWTPLGV